MAKRWANYGLPENGFMKNAVILSEVQEILQESQGNHDSRQREEYNMSKVEILALESNSLYV